jgi:hypothetical protein
MPAENTPPIPNHGRERTQLATMQHAIVKLSSTANSGICTTCEHPCAAHALPLLASTCHGRVPIRWLMFPMSTN